jgi:hypothetical protein
LNNRDDQRGRVAGLTLLAIVIIFVLLAWSDEFAVARWALLLVDFWLLALLLVPTLLLQPVLLGRRDWGLLRWWTAGAVLVLALDAAAPSDLPTISWLVLGEWLAYVVALAILFAATVGASPWRVVTHKGREADPAGWRRFLPGLPLLIGTYAAFVGSSLWFVLDVAAVRTVGEAVELASREGLTGPINDLCVGAVRPEYFAQVGQVIALLLVAVGLERRFFERLLKEPVPRALTMFTVSLLCVGEAMAISALPSPNEGCGNVLSVRHEYTAFVLTLLACFIALATLVWALVAVLPTSADRPSDIPDEADH